MELKKAENLAKRRTAPELAGDTLTSWPTFRNEISHSIGLLRQIRLQVTLFAVRLAGNPDAATMNAVVGTLARLGTVGGLADGRIGLLYMGPRPVGYVGDSALMRHVRNMIERRLGERGLTVSSDWLEIAASHAWTDELSGVDELARPLFVRSERRINGVVTPFIRLAR